MPDHSGISSLPGLLSIYSNEPRFQIHGAENTGRNLWSKPSHEHNEVSSGGLHFLHSLERVEWSQRNEEGGLVKGKPGTTEESSRNTEM